MSAQTRQAYLSGNRVEETGTSVLIKNPPKASRSRIALTPARLLSKSFPQLPIVNCGRLFEFFRNGLCKGGRRSVPGSGRGRAGLMNCVLCLGLYRKMRAGNLDAGYVLRAALMVKFGEKVFLLQCDAAAQQFKQRICQLFAGFVLRSGGSYELGFIGHQRAR